MASAQRHPAHRKVTVNPKQVKLRECLGWCGKSFDSWGPENRFCQKCLQRQYENPSPEPEYWRRNRAW
jgi:hypothetical protein